MADILPLNLDQIPAPCWVSDDSGAIRDCNQRLSLWAQLKGCHPSAGDALSMSQWLTPASRIFFETHVWPTLRHDGAVTEIFAYWHVAGCRVGAYVSASRLQAGPDSRYLWLLFAAEDRQAYEAALLQAQQRAQAQAEQLREAHARLRTLNAQLQQQIRQTEQEARQLAELSATDALTGVGNRRSLQALSHALSARPDLDKPCSVLMIDVDHFKAINDRYGHARGDEVLVALAQRLKRCARQGDYVVRYGGEEFALVLPATDARQAQAIAERIHQEIARNRLAGLSVTVSIGVATATSPEADLYEVLQHADEALYRAKAAGRNTTVCHTA
ncbi:GGDEF domain-containing protein [Rehaibacterium terrae]|uniref:diguanylate cyclase n=1 Tax=Rehaibacterium terrae TaxID=1341696 RepID=A0A7W8DEH0_9GAMM|nr:GGDEF domain-containing protein [Rehaibacterium terrae]MBB5015692.1 sigma-B regulation protein RsbU (phosphoserine phosphatase) [Rehaibacterium terrae]